MSQIAFGVQTFGWSVSEEDACRLLDVYTGAGGNYIDTADSYNEGRSEEITGSWIGRSGRRQDVILGTKVFFPTGDGPNDCGHSRKHIIDSVERSLRRLGTDHIDLLQLHCFDRQTPPDEISLTMDILVRSGKIRYWGLSNFTGSEIMKLRFASLTTANALPVSLQLEYSLLVRSSEWELLPLCADQDMGALAWSPLAGGWLSGKYRRGKALPCDSRAGVGDRWDDNADQRADERTWRIIDSLAAISGETGADIAAVSLAWMMSRKTPVFPLIGARTEQQLSANLAAADLRLSPDHIEELDRVSAVSEPYPYSFINRYGRND